MTETRFTWRWLIVIAFVGIFMGLAFGLIAGWIVFPNFGSSNIAGLSASAQNDYIVLTANTYALDRDAPRAKSRLAQLEDSDITTRVERLAKSLAARRDASAANVADLAVALGSADTSLQVMAQSVGSDASNSNTSDVAASADVPTKVARSDDETATPEEQPVAAPTDKPAKVKKPKATEAPTDAPTEAPADTAPTDVPATRAPAPTEAPTTAPAPAAPPVTTAFTPTFPDLWWDDVKFIPADVPAGQQYWQLKYARYCDWSPNDKHDTCPGMGGGILDHTIYIMTVDENGQCINTEVNDIQNDGTKFPLTIDQLKHIDYPWDPYSFACRSDYAKAMYGEGNDISVPGLAGSDKITGLCLCNKTAVDGNNILQGHAHVRYFLIFQRATR